MLVNMNDVLFPAKEGKYAVGFFNAVNVEMARAIIETAEKLNSPVMIGTAEVLLPFMPLENVADYLIPMAKRASVPVCVHFDHGLSLNKCMEALELGFSSVMYDLSTEEYETHIEELSEFTMLCHSKGVTVEGELGHVGDNVDIGKVLVASDFFTDPELAADYVLRTGVDALAVAVGNAHGDYRFPPKLDFERIETIAEITKLPLVLHGGSGLSDSDFRSAVQRGICKVNIFTDLDKAGKRGADSAIQTGAKTLTGLMGSEMDAMKAVVREKLSLFGSLGKA